MIYYRLSNLDYTKSMFQVGGKMRLLKNLVKILGYALAIVLGAAVIIAATPFTTVYFLLDTFRVSQENRTLHIRIDMNEFPSAVSALGFVITFGLIFTGARMQTILVAVALSMMPLLVSIALQEIHDFRRRLAPRRTS